jgi:hypothetical protein
LDFTTDSGKIELLRLMMKRKDWPEFLDKVGWCSRWEKHSYLYIDYLTDTTGKLRDAALEWLRKEAV